mmetsp:Transcript_15958/g.40369  ORF Transcript_15958/g.40369 Transcript_15958/m.40369 type:complete len:217 (+) Transcript_15958:396-1046(+)
MSVYTFFSSGSNTTCLFASKDFVFLFVMFLDFDLKGRAASRPFGMRRGAKRFSSLSTRLYTLSAFTGMDKPRSRRRSATVFIPCQSLSNSPSSRRWRREVTGLYSFFGSTVVQARRKTISLILILSSNVALNEPSFFFRAFFISPRIPDTVRSEAPSNFATSSADVNMSFTNAVFLNILNGYPMSLSFFTMLMLWSNCMTVPVADIRNDFFFEEAV